LGASPDLPVAALAGLTRLEAGASITATQAKSVLARMIQDGGGDPAAIAAEMGFEAMDAGALEAIVDEAIAAQPDAWSKYLAGERKALGAIVGQVMKASKGQADGKLVNEIVAKRAAAAN
jgi:aspartyl-tRNA(Asn)/glutamyl-tRNA(Gln) amidotransferase subunit B